MTKSIKRNFIYNVGYQLLQIAIPLATTPYLSRVLGPEAVGTYSFTNAIVTYYVMACVLGMSTYGVRAIASVRHDKEKRSREFWGAFVSQLLVGIVVLGVYFAYAFVAGGENLLYFLMWSPILLGNVIDVSWFLFGLEDFGYTTARSLIVRTLGVFAIFAWVKRPEDLWAYVLITAGTKLLSSLSVCPRVLMNVDMVRPSWSEIKQHFLASLRLFIPVIAISLYNTLDKIMLGVISGNTEVGYYEYAGRMTYITASIMSAMGPVMLPRVSSYIGTGKRGEAIDLLGTVLWLMLAMAFAFSFGLAAAAPTFAPVFFGDKFVTCASLMIVLAASIPFRAASNVFGRQWLLPNKRDKEYTKSVLVGALVDVCLNILVIPIWGALGASLSTIVAELAVMLAQVHFVRGELPLRTYLTYAVPFFVIGILMFVCVRGCAVLANACWGVSPLSLAVQIAVGAIVFTALSVAWCLTSKDSQFERVFLFRSAKGEPR